MESSDMVLLVKVWPGWGFASVQHLRGGLCTADRCESFRVAGCVQLLIGAMPGANTM